MSPLGDGDSGDDVFVVVLSAACRRLRRSLRPLAWMVLEEVALDAMVDDGRLLAATSARRVAERLGVDAAKAAAALRVLRERGLVASVSEHGPVGRFGLSHYQLGAVPGLTVVRAGTGEPVAAPPLLLRPALDSPVTVARQTASDPDRPGRLTEQLGRGPVSGGHADAGVTPEGNPSGRPVRSVSPPSLQRPGRKAFDLGRGSS